MKNKILAVIYLVVTATVLLYTGIRFALWDKPATKIIIHSPAEASKELQTAIKRNAKQLPTAVAQIASDFPNVDKISLKNNGNGTIEAWIKYKKIVGIWQSGEHFYPLLDNGSHLPTQYAARPASGMVFRGTLPDNISSIIAKIATHTKIARLTDFMEYVEDRRWNITLMSGAMIMLPEDDVSRALNYTESSGILDKKFTVLDLRDPDRPLVK